MEIGKAISIPNSNSNVLSINCYLYGLEFAIAPLFYRTLRYSHSVPIWSSLNPIRIRSNPGGQAGRTLEVP